MRAAVGTGTCGSITGTSSGVAVLDLGTRATLGDVSGPSVLGLGRDWVREQNKFGAGGHFNQLCRLMMRKQRICVVDNEREHKELEQAEEAAE